MDNTNKKFYCPTCNGELEMLSGCGAVGYFCNHCRKLVSRQKMLAEPAIMPKPEHENSAKTEEPPEI
jgi:hypothetical protein